MSDNNICPQCGGMKQLQIPYSLRMDNPGEPANLFVSPTALGIYPVCMGHPEPTPKHDGKINAYYEARYIQDQHGNEHVFVGDGAQSLSDHITLLPSEAVLLHAWLTQELPNLKRLAKEQEA